MTDADLTLRDEVAEVLSAHRIGYERRAYPSFVCSCGWDGAGDDGESDTEEGALSHLADALLPLLARVREEVWDEGAHAAVELHNTGTRMTLRAIIPFPVNPYRAALAEPTGETP